MIKAKQISPQSARKTGRVIDTVIVMSVLGGVLSFGALALADGYSSPAYTALMELLGRGSEGMNIEASGAPGPSSATYNN